MSGCGLPLLRRKKARLPERETASHRGSSWARSVCFACWDGSVVLLHNAGQTADDTKTTKMNRIGSDSGC